LVSSANVLLLDEPTNFLDMESIEALENVLCDYEGTVVFVSHDIAFVNKVATKVLAFENGTVKEINGKLEEYMNKNCGVQSKKTKDIDRIVLELRIAEIVSKLSMPGADKEALEAEYQRLIKL